MMVKQALEIMFPSHNESLQGEFLFFFTVTQLAGLLMTLCLFLLVSPQKNKSTKLISKINRAFGAIAIVYHDFK